MKKRDLGTLAAGIALGAALTGGTVAAGIVAQPAWSPIYVDGQQVQMEAYNIGGNNYVKLRDIGKEVGFNVYYDAGVQVDSNAPYTGEAPGQTAPTAQASPEGTVRVSCYKEGPLAAGDATGLMIYPSGTEYTVSSSNPSIVTVEKVMGQYWKANAISPGTAKITVTGPGGQTGSVAVTVASSVQSETPAVDVDLNANMEIRREMVRLINRVRKENGAEELKINEALMNAAQDCSAQMFTDHNSEYECGAAKRYGYPYGFGDNLTWFTGTAQIENAADTAVKNWVNSQYHFQTMIDPSSDTIGVGITIRNGKACCYMFAGVPNSCSAYG